MATARSARVVIAAQPEQQRGCGPAHSTHTCLAPGGLPLGSPQWAWQRALAWARADHRARDTDTLDPDELRVCNEVGAGVRTQLGLPFDCTYADSSALTRAPISAARPAQEGEPGARLSDFADRWRWFFGPNGPAAGHGDEEALRLVCHGWSPWLWRNPVQSRVPRPRAPTHGPEQQAGEELVLEYLGKRMLEPVPAPSLPPRSALADHAFIHVDGVPFAVPRTVYPWVHDFFLVQKPHQPNKWRGITNAREYNESAVKRCFKLLGLSELPDVVSPGDHMCGFDIQDFFPHCALHSHFQEHFYVRFWFRGEAEPRWLRFTSLMFGTHDAPRAAVRITKPPLQFLRSLGVKLAMFVDDGVIDGKTPRAAVRDTQLTMAVLDYLGFLLHATKCKLTPSQLRGYLGALVDCSSRVHVVLRLPPSKVKGIGRVAQAVMSKLALIGSAKLPLRLLASALGKCRSARDMVVPTYLMTRELLRWQNATLLILLRRAGLPLVRQPFFDAEMTFELPDEPLSPKVLQRFAARSGWGAWCAQVNWDADVLSVLPRKWVLARKNRLLRELGFWRHELRRWNGKWLQGVPSTLHARSFESDASGYGGGLVMDHPPIEARWHWLDSERPHSINWKEMAAPELGLRTAEREHPGVLYHSLIRGQLDNTTAVSYINRMGGSNPAISDLAERLWSWLLQMGSFMQAEHLAGVLNVRADVASRWRDDRSEWRLSEQAWSVVERRFGPHTVDLFASRRNAQLPRYFSRWQDPDAALTDAFKQPWAREVNPFAHPPISIIPRVLDKVREEKVEITLVAPVWASQAWLPRLMEMSVELPKLLLCRTLVEPCLPTRWPIVQPGWQTAVWRISGADCSSKASARAVRSALWSATATSG